MELREGDRIPEIRLKTMGSDGMTNLSTTELCKGKTVVLFGVPGAFTPLCSDQHLPGYILHADAIKAKGVDVIACVSVNDAFVMDAWGKHRGVGDKILMLADGNGDLARALGLEFDGTKFGMGRRCQRFAAVIRDGVITKWNVEAPMKFEVSNAETILAEL